MPYFDITIKETGAVATASAPTTDRLMIIGPALDGPSNQVVNITSQAEAEAFFGPLSYTGNFKNPSTGLADDTYSYNELVRAYAEAARSGANNISLCRTGGVKAQASGTNAIGGASGMALIARSPGFLGNTITATMVTTGSSGALTVVQPDNKGGTVTVGYDNTVTIGQLIAQVNSANTIGTVRLYESTTTNVRALAISVTGSAQLSGGTNGTEAPGDDNYNGKFKMYQALTTPEAGTFDSIEDMETDLIMLAGIYADDQVVTGSAATTTSVATAFAAFCASESRENLTHGFLGLIPLGYDRSDPDRINAHVKAHWEDKTPGYVDANKKWLKIGFFRDAGLVSTDPTTNAQVPVGAYISIVAGPDVRMVTSTIGAYQANPVAAYAGMVSSLPSEQAATKQLLPGTLGTAFSFREKQLRRLVNGIGFDDIKKTNGKGAFVCLRVNEMTNATEVAYDVTFSADRAPAFADLQPQRVVSEALRNIKRVLEPFLGDPFNANVHMAMEQQVRSVLDKMTEAGKLNDGGEGIGYMFTINGTSPLIMTNNEVDVQLTLWPAQQIKKIRISTTVKRP